METSLFISNPSDNSVHKVDVIEKYDDIEVIFTTSSKCYNSKDVKFISGFDYLSETLPIINSVSDFSEKELREFLKDEDDDFYEKTKTKTFKIFGWTITFSKSK
jgi:hypothetical protein